MSDLVGCPSNSTDPRGAADKELNRYGLSRIEGALSFAFGVHRDLSRLPDSGESPVSGPPRPPPSIMAGLGVDQALVFGLQESFPPQPARENEFPCPTRPLGRRTLRSGSATARPRMAASTPWSRRMVSARSASAATTTRQKPTPML